MVKQIWPIPSVSAKEYAASISSVMAKNIKFFFFLFFLNYHKFWGAYILWYTLMFLVTLWNTF